MSIVIDQGGEDSLPRPIFALGNYSREADPEAGRLHRSRADIGTLVNRAKYHPETPRSQEDARDKLVGMLLDECKSNPSLSGADAIIAVPSSNGSFSDIVAADLRRGLDIPVYLGRNRAGRGGRAAKNYILKRQYEVDQDLTGMDAIIFDDVYKTGGSLYALAVAAAASGARTCTGLVIARVLTPSL